VIHPFEFRPGTEDEGVFHAVFTANEYRLPEKFAADDIILDIGTHIGSFCYASLMRGSDHVYGFEANPENFRRASANLASFAGRVHLAHKAVWRSDRDVPTLTFLECPENNGGGSVWRPGDGPTIEAVAFDDVVRTATRNGRGRVRMVKVDCEGSEFPILLNARTLHLVDEIVGEFHEFGPEDAPHAEITDEARVSGYDRFTMKVLEGALRRAGFEVETVYHPIYPKERLGWWFAVRKDRAPSRSKAMRGPHFWQKLREKVRTFTP
jgi:FkbM family methyltransferase